MWVRPLTLKKVIVSLIATFLGLIIGYTGYTLRANQLKLRLELQQAQQAKQELDSKLNQTTQEKEQLKKQNDDLQIQLQSKIKQKAILASVTHVQAPRIVANCDSAKMCIYMKESGNNPAAINSRGCIGIGQRCPYNGVNALAVACPDWRTNYACQDAHFTAYMVARYGTWENAWRIWQIQRWW